MPRQVKIRLNTKSIAAAIKEVQDYKSWVARKTDELVRRLAEVGASEAKVRFAGAKYSGDNDTKVTVERTTNGYAITAAGGAVFFIEFGAGVYYNGTEPYPEPRPQGIVGIGEYGEGKGSRKAWGFYDESGELVITHGTPAAMPMLHASRTMMQELNRIAQEVFASE